MGRQTEGGSKLAGTRSAQKVDWITSDWHYLGEPVFPDLAMIGRIETEVERNGKIEYETRYCLCSLALCALTFARAVRAHWGVEDRLHRVLDVIFRKGLARFRTRDGPQNMAMIRHTALNLLSGARPTVSLKHRRKRAASNRAVGGVIVDHVRLAGRL